MNILESYYSKSNVGQVSLLTAVPNVMEKCMIGTLEGQFVRIVDMKNKGLEIFKKDYVKMKNRYERA